ncbi:magnesium-translocating P-type ATPase [Erysipelotrichaceae bacterium OttesenSCG-928-M19]|nr:magnesium-translocating P-type ATPase [Erysipelotrichaceae bacterium OttesenSCG-928-M19]
MFNNKETKKKYQKIIKLSSREVLNYYSTSLDGLNKNQVLERQANDGKNIIVYSKGNSIFNKLFKAFINPFTIVLLILASVSFFTDYLLVSEAQKDLTAIIIIVTMVLLSGLLTFFQTERSNRAAAKLKSLVKITCALKRRHKKVIETAMEELVCGDIIYLSAGDMIPADLRILKAKDLFVSQVSMTGESNPVEKFSKKYQPQSNDSLYDYDNLLFMGSTIISGSAIAIVIAIGSNTEFGRIAQNVVKEDNTTSFEKGLHSVSWLLIRFMLMMVPTVFLINGISKGDWLEAGLFALSIAVGLTPEMLPMIITTNLVKGTVTMAKEGTIIKNTNAVQNFGAMDILCTDKTGTLTQDKIVLEYHLDVLGNEDSRVLRHAYLNSYYQTGLKNLMDLAIIESAQDELSVDLNYYQKIDEIPFDFTRRRMSVVIKDKNNKTQLITKGAVEEIISISKYVDLKGEIKILDESLKMKILKTVNSLGANGFRVIAVAQKTNPATLSEFSIADESNMVLIGYLAFLDPPKESAKAAIKALADHGVRVKVLTGDNELVSQAVCEQVGIKNLKVIFGQEIEVMDDDELHNTVEKNDIFAKLSPQQKTRIVRVLKDNNHVVGFMGDGINDALAMKEADVGISVDTAVDIAKESADVILLEKDLMILEKGILSGRKIFGNIIKYIKLTISSNFGNMFSVLIASIFLPFLPMLPIQILLLNLIYDISCISMPWDNVDEKYLERPRNWDTSSITTFMKWFGPTSSIFDIITYLLLYFIIAPQILGGSYHTLDLQHQILFMAIFNTGWFIQSLWSQTLVIHILRTPKISFRKSHASLIVIFVTTLGVVLGTALPYLGFNEGLEMYALPLSFYGWLILIIIGYFILVNIIKIIYIKYYQDENMFL